MQTKPAGSGCAPRRVWRCDPRARRPGGFVSVRWCVGGRVGCHRCPASIPPTHQQSRNELHRLRGGLLGAGSKFAPTTTGRRSAAPHALPATQPRPLPCLPPACSPLTPSRLAYRCAWCRGGHAGLIREAAAPAEAPAGLCTCSSAPPPLGCVSAALQMRSALQALHGRCAVASRHSLFAAAILGLMPG